ncbi:hypothetical protein SASPL_142824 [Salvia splendens]|uniref:Uncharacterized protein n=1 Tax=Salvia splendens TaxID=180675 RepID=A0A8X8WMF9_SALSN|nr:hypothetical protein SASPL_142824 [Salvia splendens]
MAPSCSKTSIFSIVFIISLVLLSSGVDAGRPGRMMAVATTMTVMKEDDVSAMALKYLRENEEKLFFARLPKGVPIPPSAPSNRHNSAPSNR